MTQIEISNIEYLVIVGYLVLIVAVGIAVSYTHLTLPTILLV